MKITKRLNSFQQLWLKIGILLGICLLLFLPHILSLQAHWSSDETRWMMRSRAFMLSLQEGNLKGTLQSYHPGVMTMWLGGVGLWSKYKSALTVAPSLVSHSFFSSENLAIARRPIAITVVCIILIAFFLLRKLLGTNIAFLSTIFIASDPLFLSQSRRFHTDALAAAFLLLATLTVLLYLENSRKRYYLILSGAAFGLSCLSKSVSFIFLFWLPLAFVFYFFFKRTSENLNKRSFLIYSVYASLVWISTACLTFIALWPVIWGISIRIGNLSVPLFGFIVLCLLSITFFSYRRLRDLSEDPNLKSVSPRTTLLTLSGIAVGVGLSIFFAFKGVYTVISHIHWALTTEHEVAHFFLGKIVHDPGWLFYPFMLSIKSAPLTLPLALFGLLFTWRNRQKEEYARHYRLAIVFLLFVVLFTFFLSVTAKKFSRYLVPAFPILDILAAIGLYTMMEWVFRRIGSINRAKKYLVQFAILLLVVSIQIVPVLSLHPYYGTYYNPFWKITDITKVCTIGDASGLDIAAEYLNKKPNAKNLVVSVSPLSAEFFGYYFVGKSYRSDQQNSYLDPDYEVIYIRDLQIGRVKKEDTPGILERVISMNGIDYVWIYRLL